MSQTLVPKQYLISFRPDIILLIAMVFIWGFNAAVDPFSKNVLTISALILTAINAYMYCLDVLTVAISKTDIYVGAGLFGALLLLHWSGLFASIGGDELYHAQRSSILLQSFSSKLELLAPLSLEKARLSAWGILDLRHLAVLDIWRFLSFILTFGFVGVGIVLKATRRRAGIILILLAALTFFLGLLLQLPAENHPPLRLLPLLIGQIIFGLNNFAFRIPGLVCVWLVVWVIYLTIDRYSINQPRWWKVLSSISSAFIPVVFYCSEAVEPSIYGYAAYVLMVIIILSFIKKAEPQLLIWSGIVAGLAVLFRQSTIVLWLPVVIMFLVSSKRMNLIFAIKVFSPALLAIPYLFTARSLGHAAMSEDIPVMQKLVDSLSSGVGIMSVLNSTTLPWVFATIFSAVFIIIKGPRKNCLIFLMVIPAYCMFHVIWTYLWGIGRYQAEYVAPFISAVFMLQAISATVTVRRLYSVAFPLLIFTTIELNSNFSLDINYNQWPKMRVSTSANFPYKEAFQFVKRHEAAANTILLGGSPWYGDFVTWLYGFSFTEAKAWKSLEDLAIAQVSVGTNQSSFAKFCRERNIKYIMIQSGTRREAQHRTARMAALIEEIEVPRLEQRSLFYKLDSFQSEHGGIINLYALKQ